MSIIDIVNNINDILSNKEQLQSVVPSMFTAGATIINSFITILVALIGFSINTRLNKRNLVNEINKFKLNKHIEHMEGIPIRLLNFIDKVCEFSINKSNISKVTDELLELLDAIIAYGSEDSVKIVSEVHKFRDLYAHKIITVEEETYYENEEFSNKLTALLSLLLCQVKHDLTGIFINPKIHYGCRVVYASEDIQETLDILTTMANVNNITVSKLKLNKKLKVNMKALKLEVEEFKKEFIVSESEESPVHI